MNNTVISVRSICPESLVTCAKRQLAEVSVHDLGASAVQRQVQRKAVEAERRVRFIQQWGVSGL